MDVIFCHGLESAPHGRKYHALRDAGLRVEAPDFRGMNLAARVAALEAILAVRPAPPVVVGSSYGGITAVLAALRQPVARLVLCAPALGVREPPADGIELRAGAPTTIIHGTRDDVCPIERSRTFCRDNPSARLIEVDDDHFLANSLDRIVEQSRG